MRHRGRANKTLLVAKETFLVVSADRGTVIIDGVQFLSVHRDPLPKMTLMDAEARVSPRRNGLAAFRVITKDSFCENRPAIARNEASFVR